MAETTRLSGTNLMFTFLAGAAAGTIVALLTAPHSGRETRQRLGRRARQGAEDLEDIL